MLGKYAVSSLDAYEQALGRVDEGACVVLHFESCTSNVAFELPLDILAEEREFAWLYVKPGLGTDLVEAFGVTSLPSLVVMRKGASQHRTLHSPSMRHVVAAVEQLARRRPTLTLDADF